MVFGEGDDDDCYDSGYDDDSGGGSLTVATTTRLCEVELSTKGWTMVLFG